MHPSYGSSRGKSTLGTRLLRLDDLTWVIHPQHALRDGLFDYGLLDNYSEALDRLSPAVVIREGECLWFTDDVHLYEAFREAGRKRIPCEVRNGTWPDAIRLWNRKNFISTAGVRQAIRAAFAYEKAHNEHWPTRYIADLVNCSHTLVALLRRDPAHGGRVQARRHRPAERWSTLWRHAAECGQGVPRNRENALAALDYIKAFLLSRGAFDLVRKHWKMLRELTEALPDPPPGRNFLPRRYKV